MSARDLRDQLPTRMCLFLTIIVGVLQLAALTACRFAVVVIALDYGAVAWVLGVLSALFMAVPMMTMVHAGRWMDRIGLGLPAALASLVTLMAMMAAVAAPSLYMMFLMAPLVGGSTVFSHVAVTRAVGLTDDRVIRARNLGYLSVGLSLSQVLGPVIIGTTYDLYGVRIAFAATAVLPLLSLVIIACGSHLFAVDRRASKEPPDRRQAIDLMRLHGLRRWLIANGVFAAAITLIPLVMPLHAADVGISASVTSGIIAAVALGSITMRSFVAVLLARFRSEALLGGALVFAALTYSMLPFFHDWRWLTGVSLFLGMSLGLGQPISMSLIYSEAPQGRVNESLGLALSLASFQQMLAPLTLGLIASSLGIAPMVWMVAIILAASALYTVSGREQATS